MEGKLGGKVDKKELVGARICGVYLHAGKCEPEFEPRYEGGWEGHYCMFSIFLIQL